MKMLIIKLKKLVLLRHHNLHIKPTIILYLVIQQCQVKYNLFFYVFYCNLKGKDHTWRNIYNEKRNVYM